METVLKGKGACVGVVGGTIRVIYTPEEAADVQEFEILATQMTTPDMIQAMNRCRGWVTKQGGITCHAAIIARELKKPCVVGLGEEQFSQLVTGMTAVVDGAAGTVEIR